MAADLTKPFAESCCEGGGYTSDMSAQSCGCDPGANWTCQRHREQVQTLADSALQKHLDEVIDVTWNFAGRLITPRDHEMNALIGLASEAGETLDIGKKMWYHSEKDFSFFRPKLVLELGDILYYFLKVLDVFGVSLKEVIDGNREKLASRHPELNQVTERYDGNHIR